jgi:hypothetical protein
MVPPPYAPCNFAILDFAICFPRIPALHPLHPHSAFAFPASLCCIPCILAVAFCHPHSHSRIPFTSHLIPTSHSPHPCISFPASLYHISRIPVSDMIFSWPNSYPSSIWLVTYECCLVASYISPGTLIRLPPTCNSFGFRASRPASGDKSRCFVMHKSVETTGLHRFKIPFGLHYFRLRSPGPRAHGEGKHPP